MVNVGIVISTKLYSIDTKNRIKESQSFNSFNIRNSALRKLNELISFCRFLQLLEVIKSLECFCGSVFVADLTKYRSSTPCPPLEASGGVRKRGNRRSLALSSFRRLVTLADAEKGRAQRHPAVAVALERGGI